MRLLSRKLSRTKTVEYRDIDCERKFRELVEIDIEVSNLAAQWQQAAAGIIANVRTRDVHTLSSDSWNDLTEVMEMLRRQSDMNLNSVARMQETI